MGRRALALALVVVCASCGGGSDDPARDGNEAGSDVTGEAATPAGWLTPDQRRRADQLVSVFENSTTEIQYNYAENLGDGRGVTSGRAGFTTATCDALAVIDLYSSAGGDDLFAPFVDELQRLCDEGDDDTTGLPEDAYIQAWHEAAGDDRFLAAQDQVVDEEYYEPAMRVADELDIEMPLARAQLYDTAIQHGAGDDPDGLAALVQRTNDRVGFAADVDEVSWLMAYLDVRLEDLNDPFNADTAEAWRESVDRVTCMRTLAEAGNTELDGPLTCTVYGDEFTIE